MNLKFKVHFSFIITCIWCLMCQDVFGLDSNNITRKISQYDANFSANQITLNRFVNRTANKETDVSQHIEFTALINNESVPFRYLKYGGKSLDGTQTIELRDVKYPNSGRVINITVTWGEPITFKENIIIDVSSLGRVNNARVSDVVMFNILDYEGATLDEKWNNLRQSFTSWTRKQVIIPYPREGLDACIKVGNDWKWKVSSPLLFTDDCNELEIAICGELYVTKPVESVLLFSDTSKPENITFSNGVSIRGDRNKGGYINTAIDIRSATRLNFLGQVIINDCMKGVVIGGNKQMSPSEAKFDKLQIGFVDEVGIECGGASHPCYFNANNVNIQIMQKPERNAVEIWDNTVQFRVGVLHYATDTKRQGYSSHDAFSVLHVKQKEGKLIHNIIVDDIYGTIAKYGVYIEDGSNYGIYDLHFKTISIPAQTGIAVKASECAQLYVESISQYNIVQLNNCFFSQINGVRKYKESVVDNTCVNNIISVSDDIIMGPSKSLLSKTHVGDYVLVKDNERKTERRLFLNIGESFIPADGQMYCNIVETLPKASYKMRGKIYLLEDDRRDRLYICVKIDGDYAWQLINLE